MQSGFNFPEYIYVIMGVALVLGAMILVYTLIFGEQEGPDLSNYIRKSFLFDSKAEFDLFKMLVEFYGDKFFIFPQVHYVHLIQPRKGLEHRKSFGLRSRIDKKSADFVLCDKDRVVPQLIIELDGPTHELPDRKKRDDFINEITRITDLKIFHLKTADLNRDFVRAEIDKKLAVDSQNKSY